MSPCGLACFVECSVPAPSTLQQAAGVPSSLRLNAIPSAGWTPKFIHSSVGGLPLPSMGSRVSLQTPARVLPPPRSRPSCPVSRLPVRCSFFLLAFGSCLRAFACASPPLHCLCCSLPRSLKASSSQYSSFISRVKFLHRGLISHETDKTHPCHVLPGHCFRLWVAPGIVTFHSPVYLFSVAH